MITGKKVKVAKRGHSERPGEYLNYPTGMTLLTINDKKHSLGAMKGGDIAIPLAVSCLTRQPIEAKIILNGRGKACTHENIR